MKRRLFSIARWTVIGLAVFALAAWLKPGFWSLLAIVGGVLFIDSMLSGYLESVFLSPHASFEKRPWTQYTLHIAPHSLRLKLPTGESRDWPATPVVECADPDDAGAYDSSGDQRVLEKHWDDPKVSSSLGAGTVKLVVLLHQVLPGAPEDVTQLDGLAKYLDRTIRKYYQELEREDAAKGRQFPKNEPPEAYERTMIAGRPWLALIWPAVPDITVYMLPLSPRAYLRLQFTRISTGPRPQWVEEANVLRDKIISQIVLENANR